jgi:hypothetical protein
MPGPLADGIVPVYTPAQLRLFLELWSLSIPLFERQEPNPNITRADKKTIKAFLFIIYLYNKYK